MDEAGRGPAIGPMVVAAALFNEDDISNLLEMGVNDSKKLSQDRREELAEEIKDIALDYQYFIVSPRTIDQVVLNNRRLRKLNYLTTMIMAKIIRDLSPDVAYVDACDVIPERCKRQILRVLPYRPDLICEHNADVTYPATSSASILAKVKRDSIIEDLHREYGDFYSGYPSDEGTRAWLKSYFDEHREVPHFIRRSWLTVRKLLGEID
ncbi:MAG: ribonuclease HII [Candidatus Bathyarchaeia archaeon]